MPVIRPADTVVHEFHGVSFTSYAAPARGSRELCAWRIDIPDGVEGVAHRISREEVFYVLSGALDAVIDGQPCHATAGDVLLAPAGSVLSVSTPAATPLTAWVTTSAGLGAVLPDGSWLTPPWAS
jgi:mannose-6-phosphate isomerase-like protein (cupin superfamily)